jgi:hypothetical protein
MSHGRLLIEDRDQQASRHLGAEAVRSLAPPLAGPDGHVHFPAQPRPGALGRIVGLIVSGRPAGRRLEIFNQVADLVPGLGTIG